RLLPDQRAARGAAPPGAGTAGGACARRPARGAAARAGHRRAVARSAGAERHRRRPLATVAAGVPDRRPDRAHRRKSLRGLIVLSHTLYRSLSLRPAADIDVLVRPQERPAARHALRTLGYGHRAQLLFAEAHHPYHDPQYFRATRRGEVCLELHHALWHPRFFARDDGIFDRAVVVELDGAAVRTLSPEDTLLHLAIHRTRSPLRLRLVCDAAEPVRA